MPLKFECDGIGTHWWFELLDETVPPDMEERVISMITRFDEDYSRFKTTSYIGQLNDTKILLKPPRELVDMFTFAKEMYEASHGVFDMSVGGELHAKGYGSRRLAAPIHANMWREAIVSTRQIQIPQTVVVDNGGFGKGWLIDSIGKFLKEQAVEQFVINGGGDILVTSDVPLQFGLEDPQLDKLIGSVMIARGALAGSSNNKRTWQHKGQSYEHIVDPTSERDEVKESVVGTFVTASSALIADTMATILLLRPELNDELTKKFHLRTMLIPGKAKTKTSL